MWAGRSRVSKMPLPQDLPDARVVSAAPYAPLHAAETRTRAAAGPPRTPRTRSRVKLDLIRARPCPRRPGSGSPTRARGGARPRAPAPRRPDSSLPAAAAIKASLVLDPLFWAFSSSSALRQSARCSSASATRSRPDAAPRLPATPGSPRACASFLQHRASSRSAETCTALAPSPGRAALVPSHTSRGAAVAAGGLGPYSLAAAPLPSPLTPVLGRPVAYPASGLAPSVGGRIVTGSLRSRTPPPGTGTSS
jgi:hypothetical protein